MSKPFTEISARVLKLALRAQFALLWHPRSQPDKVACHEAQYLVRFTRRAAGEDSLLGWIPEVALSDWGEVARYMRELHEMILASKGRRAVTRDRSFAKLGYFGAASRLTRFCRLQSRQWANHEAFFTTESGDAMSLSRIHRAIGVGRNDLLETLGRRRSDAGP